MMKISIDRSMGQPETAASWFRIEVLIPAGVAALALVLAIPADSRVTQQDLPHHRGQWRVYCPRCLW